MDVTTQIRRAHQLYGGSYNSNPRYASAQRSMQLGGGNNINSPIILPTVHSVPFRYEFDDVIGLPGKENKFYKVHFDLETVNGCYEEPQWDCANVIYDDYDHLYPGGGSWSPLKWSYNKDLVDYYQDYAPVKVNNDLPSYSDPMASVHVIKKDTGNQYTDKWVDVRLYNTAKEEHPNDIAFLGLRGSALFGIHARNTKELPYKVAFVIGKQFLPGAVVKAIDRI